MKSYDKQPDEVLSEEVTSASDTIDIPEYSTTMTEDEAEKQGEESSEASGEVDVEEQADHDASDQNSLLLEPTLPAGELVQSTTAPDDPPAQPLLEEEDFLQNDPAIVSRIQPPLAAGSGFRWPSRDQLLAWAPFGVVFLLGAILRFWDLGAKPLHHDESLHAYYSLQLLHNLQHWGWCVGLNNPPAGYQCYQYDPLLHGPFQFHAIALVYQISQWLGAPDNGVNTTTVRIMAALLGSVLVALPYFLRDYLGKFTAWLSCFLLAVSPSMVYFSRFAREDIYMACFTLLMVVSVARYVRERKIGWLVLTAAGFALSYATSEATFLTIAIFGSFLGALIVWEIGTKLPLRSLLGDPEAGRYLPRTFSGVFVLVYFLILGIIAKVFFGVLDGLSTYINNNQAVSENDLLSLESITVKVLPWLGIILGLVVFSILALEVYGMIQPGRRGLARFVDRRRQPVLDTILTMPWTHWFFALIVGIAIFLLLFTVVFTNIYKGIGDGIWRGLYYWLEQQKVARGGQPW
ncbi:MAG TPA: flippase activity-associated protein Agl23, partial [Ktedonobacteraceae bacterium]